MLEGLERVFRVLHCPSPVCYHIVRASFLKLWHSQASLFAIMNDLRVLQEVVRGETVRSQDFEPFAFH